MSFETDALPDVLDHLWTHLEAATQSAKPPFHLPALCTVDGDGLPRARIVVLRQASRRERRLVCHTDARAEKIDHLRQRPNAAWLFYDGPAKVQLRATGRVTVHTDDALADERWKASSLSSRRCYLAPRTPGRQADGPSPNLPPDVRGRVPTEPETQTGRRHFAVVSCVVERFDWLYLHHAGHRRAEFVWPDGTDTPTMQWLEP
ncbi:MAG: pyridoxamine 5'-phosphate oxidase family protein [Planctomycetota bacterium]